MKQSPHKQWAFSSEELDSRGSTAQPINFPYESGHTPLQYSQLGNHSRQRKPTKEDYANFVLYQASQKTYEAVFLKTFVNHALQPDQLGKYD